MKQKHQSNVVPLFGKRERQERDVNDERAVQDQEQESLLSETEEELDEEIDESFPASDPPSHW